MFAYFDKEMAAVIYAGFIANTPCDNHFGHAHINSQIFYVHQNFCVTDAVAMLPGSNATVFYSIWLIVAISLLAHCC